MWTLTPSRRRRVMQYYGRDAAKRLLPLSKSPHMSLEEAFPRCDRDALKMVERLLRMDPSARASTRDILLDPYFADIRSSKHHKDWMAENLVPNPRVLELIHSKAALVSLPRLFSKLRMPAREAGRRLITPIACRLVEVCVALMCDR